MNKEDKEHKESYSDYPVGGMLDKEYGELPQVVKCEVCYKILSSDERAQYDVLCYSCVFNETAGGIEDTCKELNFDED